LYVTSEDRGRIGSLLKNWPETDVRVIVITDGERILGLGDLGANGMGIPIGKLALYTTLAGIHPSQCMPVQFDVGTDNAPLRDDPLYLGVPAPRLRGEPYYELMEEFVMSVQEAYPHALIQFEDFLTPRAFALLRRYRHRVLCFNDDIQGTAAVVLAGAYSAAHIAERPLEKSRVMFLGAGSAATGIADLMVHALVERGLTPDDARRCLWFVDISGLVVQSRRDLQPHNLPYAHPHPPMEFVDALRAIRPHMLIGATGHPGTFTREVVRVMAELNDRPVIFALSNPTSRAECTAAQAYEWSGGRVVFASGSPFPPIDLGGGRMWRPGQGNNAYVFPGIGLGAVGCRAKRVTDNMFLAAARALADAVSADDLAAGALYPPLKDVRSVSLAIAAQVAETAYDDGVAQAPRPESLVDHLAAQMYSPIY
jgi:malate dehydrogenase (oxaloacetate-decarboxylating)(NADP+)